MRPRSILLPQLVSVISMNQPSRQPAVGIDLGTTFSAVAYLDATGRPETIRNAEGDLTTPSAVFFDHNRPIVGMEAVEAGLLEPDRLALFAKRDVGESYYEKTIRGQQLPAEVIEALILRKLKSDAELALGEIRQAVITVPAFFNEPCRKATQDAGKLAGLNVLDIINEPTAAAITYGVQQGFLSADGQSQRSETVLVYDLGGGTFDVTVMKIEGRHFHTVATAGDVYLGGVDWDNRVVEFIAEAFVQQHGVDPRNDPQAEQELLRKANQTKHALTQRESVSVAFAHDGHRLRIELTQQEFSKRCADLVERTLMTVQLVLDDAGISWGGLTRLILVGGSTRMPMIRQELERLSGMELDRSLSPDEAVCHGAALYAGMLMANGNDSAGLDSAGLSVSNVNSHDLGILAVDPKTGQPRRQVMIPRNSHLPARKKVRFRTHSDNQANVKIEIVEGGDDRGTNATRIGRCLIDDLPPGTPKGTHVDVRFDYARDGRLTVRASLPEIDRKIAMTLNRAAGLNEEQLALWMQRLDDGLSDATLALLEQETSRPTPENDSNAASQSERSDATNRESVPVENPVQGIAPQALFASVQTQPAPTQPAQPHSPQNAEPTPAESNASTPDQPATTPASSTSVHIALDSLPKTTVQKVRADELSGLVGETALDRSAVNVRPQIDLGEQHSARTKADVGDLQLLASLSDRPTGTDSVDKPSLPSIAINVDAPSTEKPRKSGFWKRKKN